ncbi:hypothetical protein [Acinetobacter variabilis]|uniref:hypothetical protein n=1 Tax=Acinetobacter variabilis TaxID=70346 RepID=UPI003D784F8B
MNNEKDISKSQVLAKAIFNLAEQLQLQLQESELALILDQQTPRFLMLTEHGLSAVLRLLGRLQPH